MWSELGKKKKKQVGQEKEKVKVKSTSDWEEGGQRRWKGKGKRNPSVSEGTETRQSSERDMGMERRKALERMQ